MATSPTTSSVFTRVIPRKGARRTPALVMMLALFCLAALAAGVLAQTAEADVTLDGAVDSNSTNTTNTTSISVGHTTGTGTDRLMLVGISANSYNQSPARTISSVTFTATGSPSYTHDLALVGNVQNETGRLAAIYALLDPPGGRTGTVTVTFSAAVNYGIVAGVANFQGVAQDIPLGTFTSAVGTDDTPLVTAATAADDVVFDTVFLGSAPQVGTLAADDSQTGLWSRPAADTNSRLAGAASSETALGTTTTMSWTVTGGSTTRYWAIAAVPIKPAPEGTTYDLTVIADPSSSGTTDPGVGVHTYPEGTIVDISATHAPGYRFDHWEGDVANADAADTTVTMDADKTVTAHFVATTYDLTMAVSGGGGSTTPAVGPHTYDADAVVPVTATPDTGYRFDHWTGDVADANAASTTVTMDADKTVTAYFVATHELTMQVSGSGGSTTPAVGPHTYDADTTVDISATADPGYRFDHWEGDVANADAADTTVTMDADKTVMAYFAQEEYTLTVNIVGQGAVIRMPPLPTTYHYGDQVELTAAPDTGWGFAGWSGDLTDSENPLTVTVHGNMTVIATFSQPYVDGAVSSDTSSNTSATSISFSHITGTGANRLMLVGVSWNCGSVTTPSIGSVTFAPSGGGDDLTLDEVRTVKTDSSTRYSAIYSLLGPPNGVTGTVTVTLSPSIGNGIVAGAVNFAGVDSLGPDNGVSATTGAGPMDLTLSGLSGDELVFANVFLGYSSGQALHADAAQSQLWSKNVGNAEGVASTVQASGDSVTMSWTADTSAYWAIAAVAINPAPVVATHELTMAVDASGGGTVDPDVGTHTYDAGALVPVTAMPDAGYRFDHWDGDVADANAASTTVTMDADQTVTAYFVATHVLTMAVDASGGGTVDPDVGTHTYDAGALVPVTAMPDAGYRFDHWDGDVADANAASTTVTMDADQTVTAYFVATHVLTMAVDASGGGTVDPDVGTHTYDAGALVPVTAMPDAGYRFDHWDGDVADANAASTTVTMDADQTVTAYFVATHVLTMAVDASGGGTVDPDVGTHTYDAGALVPVTAMPDAGYRFDHWDRRRG